MGDHRGDQRHVVGVLAGAHTDAAFEFGVGQVFVGRQFARFDPFLGHQCHAGTGRQAEPQAFRIAEVGGDVLFKGIGLHGLQHAAFLQGVQAADVDGQHRVGGAIVAGGLDLFQHALLGEHDVHLDPRFLGEGVEERLDQERLAIGIEVHFLVGSLGPGGGAEDSRGGDKTGRKQAFHMWHFGFHGSVSFVGLVVKSQRLVRVERLSAIPGQIPAKNEIANDYQYLRLL